MTIPFTSGAAGVPPQKDPQGKAAVPPAAPPVGPPAAPPPPPGGEQVSFYVRLVRTGRFVRRVATSVVFKAVVVALASMLVSSVKITILLMNLPLPPV